MRALILATLVACSSSPPPSETFDGTVHRFVIDRFDLPSNHAQSLQFGDDLDGDHAVDNQVGILTGLMASQNDLASSPSDMRALLPTAIEINTHDLTNDDHVGVSYIGQPGDMPTPATGAFVDGAYVSERTHDTAHPANGAMVLPIFIDADPTEFPFEHGEIELQPDGTGGYTGQLHGLIDPDVALRQAAASTYQMLRSNPKDHAGFAEFLTGTFHPPVAVTLANVETSELFDSYLAADISIDATHWLSFGFQFHIVPCDVDPCASTPVIDHCDDRVQDADETDIDCGGSCHACGFDTTCVGATDCQTGACDNGMCREPTCDDGIQDGFEVGIDCGAYGCARCPGQ